MSTPTPQLIRVERVDDLPVLWASLQRLGVAELLDRRYPKHHLWLGELSFGEVTCVWLTFVLSRGDHRLSQLQPWAQQHLLTLQALLGKTVRSLDFHDDRLADILSALPQAETWLSFETDLNQRSLRVYDLSALRFRLDTTTANSYADVVSEEGLLQFGHSKDNDDLPQLKVATAALDPLGMPVATLVVPGNSADDPWYIPLAQQVQQAVGKGGKTYIGDCKMAALATRAYLVSTGDYYLCPLAEKQFSRTQRLEQIRRVRQGQQAVQPVYRPKDNPADDDELVAEGFALEVALEANGAGKAAEHPPGSPPSPGLEAGSAANGAGRAVRWTERRWVVRSVAFAEGQAKQLERRLERAQEEMERLGERKQGKVVLSAAAMAQAVAALVEQHRVEGLLSATVRTTRQERTRRRYRGRPEQVVVEEEHRVEVVRREEAIAELKGELGWQVYGVNDLGLSLATVVWGYRDQYQVEKGWSRLKGQPLSLTPMYLTDETRMRGLVLLLSLALRVLTLLQWTVRRQLNQSGEPLRGLYPGQPGRKTSSPSAELLLAAFKDISLTVVAVAGHLTVLLTPLTTLQQKLLALWDCPADLYQRLTSFRFSQPPLVLSEP
jgi:transposase